MNKAKALLGWNAGLIAGRDYRVEDHLDGNGQAIVWLSNASNPPCQEDLEAGWVTWLNGTATSPADPIRALAAQIGIILHVLDIPATEPFQLLFGKQDHSTPMQETEHGR